METKTSRIKIITSGIIPFVFILLMIAYIFGPGSSLLGVGVSLPELTIEKINFEKSKFS